MPRGIPLYVAVHEAGHAVAIMANACRRNIESLSIIEQPNGQLGFTASQARFQPAFGHHYAKPSVAVDLVEAARLDTIELLAGPIAERRFRRQSEADRLFAAHYLAEGLASGRLAPTPDEDAAKIMLRLRWLDDGPLVDAFITAWQQTENVLRPRWKSVVELGRWLHQQGRIEEKELYCWWDLKLLTRQRRVA
ncbi:hypothetical protein QP166_05155 [Sphingomonas sp. LR60]|uniref:hypothetical protein n=1 Tax=Sphingomonas sp. LR60 TaxID=3050233 RepID=UPI002FE0A19D